jgi:hypothetical protein
MALMAFLVGLFVVGFAAAVVIGSQAYFLGEQTKPIHERNWRSDGFEDLAVSITGKSTDYSNRVPAFSGDAYSSATLPSK